MQRMGKRHLFKFTGLALATAISLTGCRGGSSGGNDGQEPIASPPPASTPPPSPPPAPMPSPSDPPATNLLPPAPFGLTTSADFSLVGWQATSQKDADPLVATADHKGALAWSANLKTYALALADLGSGRLVYTFPPSSNNAAFSIVQANGSVARVYVTILVKTANVGEIYWRTADGVTPFVYARAVFGIPIAVGSLPNVGQRVFTTDADPQSSIMIDFVTKKVSGTVTSFNDGGGWDPPGPKEHASIEPADIQPDGSFVANLNIPGAPKKGVLRGRLFGSAGTELGIHWDGPVRNGYDGAFGDWRTVMNFAVCSSCPG